MRALLVFVACLLVAAPATAQSHSNAACLDLGELVGQPAGVLWTHSFREFLQGHESALSQDQAKLLQQAIEFGASKDFDLSNSRSLHAIDGLLTSARRLLTVDQFSEILAGMGYDTQQALRNVALIDVVACSCTIGGGGGPDGFTCKAGCYTWGTGDWNGVYKMNQVDQQ